MENVDLNDVSEPTLTTEELQEVVKGLSQVHRLAEKVAELDEVLTSGQAQLEAKVDDIREHLQGVQEPTSSNMDLLSFLKELRSKPELVMELASLFGRVLSPWESSGGSGNIAVSHSRMTAQGKVVAIIWQEQPTWKVEVDGEQVSKVHNAVGLRSKVDEVKIYVNKLLQEKGYLILSEEVEEIAKWETAKKRA